MRGNRYYRRHYHQSKIRASLKRVYRQLVLMASVFFVVFLFGVRTYHVHDAALQPEIQPGDIILVNLWQPKPEDGDIVLVYPPYASRHTPFTFVRFTIQGMWERIASYERDPDYVYRAKLRRVGIDEAVPQFDIPHGFFLHDFGIEENIPDDQIAVYAGGDGSYLDSRHYGPVSRRMVRGVAFYRLWPFDRIGTIPGN